MFIYVNLSYYLLSRDLIGSRVAYALTRLAVAQPLAIVELSNFFKVCLSFILAHVSMRIVISIVTALTFTCICKKV